MNPTSSSRNNAPSVPDSDKSPSSSPRHLHLVVRSGKGSKKKNTSSPPAPSPPASLSPPPQLSSPEKRGEPLLIKNGACPSCKTALLKRAKGEGEEGLIRISSKCVLLGGREAAVLAKCDGCGKMVRIAHTQSVQVQSTPESGR